MDNQQELVKRVKYNVNKHLLDKVWTNEKKGLRKEVINFRYCSIVKASDLSKCLVDILEFKLLDPEKHHSNYLLEENIGKEFWIELGLAVTPVDCYIELFLKEMLTNETSKCYIDTKSSGTIEFTIRLKRIEFGGYYAEQEPAKMYELAKLYKENGVKMFKNYPKFAHNYFNQAAKCLLTFYPFDDIEVILENSSLTCKDFEELLDNINLNISASLIKEKRFEEVLHVLRYTNDQLTPSEKSIYRLASAYFELKQYEKAKLTVERCDYKKNKDLVQLWNKNKEFWKVEETKYSNMVKKMFG